MSAELFLDTNIFVYQLDASDKRKHGIAEGLVREALQSERGCISFQVVQECINTLLRKSEIALEARGARAYLEAVLLPLMKVGATAALYQRALDLQSRWRFGFHDSLIVASALSAGCTRLLTEDLQHGQRIETLTVENPFKR
jgi:predicted nucleic acid-binding protein